MGAGGGAIRLGIWCFGSLTLAPRRVGLVVYYGAAVRWARLLLLGSGRAVRACWRGARDVVGPSAARRRAATGDRRVWVGVVAGHVSVCSGGQQRRCARPRFASRDAGGRQGQGRPIRTVDYFARFSVTSCGRVVCTA